MVWWIEMLAAKSEDPSSTPGSGRKESIPRKLSSDYKHAMALVLGTHADIYI